jgi:hypothetical protein
MSFFNPFGRKKVQASEARLTTLFPNILIGNGKYIEEEMLRSHKTYAEDMNVDDDTAEMIFVYQWMRFPYEEVGNSQVGRTARDIFERCFAGLFGDGGILEYVVPNKTLDKRELDSLREGLYRLLHSYFGYYHGAQQWKEKIKEDKRAWYDGNRRLFEAMLIYVSDTYFPTDNGISAVIRHIKDNRGVTDPRVWITAPYLGSFDQEAFRMACLRIQDAIRLNASGSVSSKLVLLCLHGMLSPATVPLPVDNALKKIEQVVRSKDPLSFSDEIVLSELYTVSMRDIRVKVSVDLLKHVTANVSESLDNANKMLAPLSHEINALLFSWLIRRLEEMRDLLTLMGTSDDVDEILTIEEEMRSEYEGSFVAPMEEIANNQFVIKNYGKLQETASDLSVKSWDANVLSKANAVVPEEIKKSRGTVLALNSDFKDPQKKNNKSKRVLNYDTPDELFPATLERYYTDNRLFGTTNDCLERLFLDRKCYSRFVEVKDAKSRKFQDDLAIRMKDGNRYYAFIVDDNPREGISVRLIEGDKLRLYFIDTENRTVDVLILLDSGIGPSNYRKDPLTTRLGSLRAEWMNYAVRSVHISDIISSYGFDLMEHESKSNDLHHPLLYSIWYIHCRICGIPFVMMKRLNELLYPTLNQYIIGKYYRMTVRLLEKSKNDATVKK